MCWNGYCREPENNLYHDYTGAGAVINIILDPILIFGLLGFPRMGISGAAIATVTGQLAGMGMNVYFNKRVNHEVQFVFRGSGRIWES